MLIFFRYLAIALALVIIYCAAAYLVSRDRRFLTWALRLLSIGVIGGLIFFGGLILQRLV